jgi:hydroxymethylpyrimidine pyrophosphatase-like HAD family hydrolase
MGKRGVLFSDVDGTLCFHQEAHGIREIERNPDRTVVVEDSITGKRHLTYDISASSYRVFLAIDTQRLGHELQKLYDFVYVTGARPSTVHSRKEYLDFADAIILENGGMILDNSLQPNQEWVDQLAPEREYLADVAEQLRGEDWVLDDRGRTSALRVRKRDNPHRSSFEFEKLCSELTLPETLKKTINMENLDIILRSAGKGNAVRFWMRSRGYHITQSIGIGDDINDLDFLKVTGEKYVLSSSFPEVVKVAEEEGWHISKNVHFDGINEIMRHILSM